MLFQGPPVHPDILYDGVFFKHATAYSNGFCFLGGLFICLWLIWFIATEILFHRYTRKPLAIFFILLNTTAFYFMFTYNATIDKIMFLNILQTDVSEVRDLLRPRFFWFMLVLGILPAAMILKTRILPSSRRRHMAAISIAAGSFRMQPTPDSGTQSPVKTRPKPPRQAAPTPQT